MGMGPTITLEEKGDGWWTAMDETSGAVSQGASRDDALDRLERAISLVDRNDGAPEPRRVPDSVWFDE